MDPHDQYFGGQLLARVCRVKCMGAIEDCDPDHSSQETRTAGDRDCEDLHGWTENIPKPIEGMGFLRR